MKTVLTLERIKSSLPNKKFSFFIYFCVICYLLFLVSSIILCVFILFLIYPFIFSYLFAFVIDVSALNLNS